MRRTRLFPVEEIVLAQLVPGFLFTMGWTAMYEIYHEEGSYFTTLIQEILGSEGLFPSFLVLAVLMSFPVGMIVDAVRYVVGEVWLDLPRTASRGGRSPFPPEWRGAVGGPVQELERRYNLTRNLRTSLLTPARAAGNLALVVLVLTVWSTVKIFLMGGVHAFSLAFVIGAPLMGAGLVLVLLVRYVSGLREFHREVHESLFPSKEPASLASATEAPLFSPDPSDIPVVPSRPEGS